MGGRYIPEHIPWEFEEDVFTPMPWIPEGSLVSKNRFYEVRQAQRPKSYSPPPTPPASNDVLPLDALPFPAIIPSSTEGPTLKRAVSFHPGGSQRLRREALVINGKVTIDTGFKLRSRSRGSIVPSSSEPSDMDLIARQLNTGHQSGLERLKNSMLRLMKTQPQRRSSMTAKGRKRSETSFSTAAPIKTKDNITEETSHEPLAVRRGLPVPSTLKLVSTRPLLASPYHPDIPTPFRGSPPANTLLYEASGILSTSTADKHESIDVEDMCTNLRHLVSPVISKSPGKEKITSSQNDRPAAGRMSTPDDAVNEIPRTPIEDWTFASELEGVYGDNPFSYFDAQERMPSFIGPLSKIPNAETERNEMQQCSDSSATSFSTFPDPPADNQAVPRVPYITISGGEPAGEQPAVQAQPSFPSSAIASDEDLMDSEDNDEMGTSVIVSSTDTSPRSSEDKNEPLAVRRLTLLARSSTAIPGVDYFTSARNLQSSSSSRSMSLAQGTLKLVTKIVRFAPETEERTYLEGPVATYSSPKRQNPRSSSVPPPQKGSLRNQTFLQQDECKSGRLSRSQPITFPSRIPKKRTFTRIVQGSTEALPIDGRNGLTPPGSEHESEGKKRLSSSIPVLGLKAPSFDRKNGDSGRRVVGHNSRLYVSLKQPSRTPKPQSTPAQQRTPLATSWSMTLRQYVKGSGPSDEKRQVSHSPSPRRHGELKFLPASSVGTKEDGKSLLPVKKASFFRDGVGKVTPASEVRNRIETGQERGVGGDDDMEGKAIGSVDKTGGISYIAPPKVRAASQSRGRVTGERQGTAGTKSLRPVQIRNLLGRLA